MPTPTDHSSLPPLIALQQSLAAAGDRPSLLAALPQALLLALQVIGGDRGLLLLRHESGDDAAWAAADGQVRPTADDALLDAVRAREAAPGSGASHSSRLVVPFASGAINTLIAPLWDGRVSHGSLAVASDEAPASDLGLGLQLCAGLLAGACARVEAQEGRRTAVQQEAELERLRDELAAMLVHDLQGPLGNIVASLEFAQTSAAAEEWAAVLPMLEIALHSGHQLRTLVDSVLDISRLEAGQALPERQAVAPHDLIADTLAIVQPELEMRDIRVVVDIAPDTPPVTANPAMMRRVLLNLLDNALKVSRSGQTVRIRAARDSAASHVRLVVVDEGSGVPEAYREQIFQKYQRLNNGGSSKGLGLGLAFCRLAVEAHGGTIWVEDTPGGGASFHFTLPLATAVEA